MAVTDLSDLANLPWWLRSGATPPQGPGATGSPGAAPMGAGGQPGAGNSASWFDYLSSMFGPNAAQADTLTQNQQLNALLANRAPGPPPADNRIDPTVANPPTPPGGPPARPATGMGLQPGALSSANLGAYNGMPWPSGGGSLNPAAPAPAGSAAPGSSAPPAANPLASAGGAGGQGAMSNPRFVQLDRGQNIDPLNRRGGPQMTALNLAGLFGGPANVPSRNAQAVSGPLAAGGGVSSAPWGVGPLQKGMVWPSDMGPFTPNQRASRSLKQRYG